MAAFTRSDDLQGATFVGANLRGARFVESDLSGVVMRGVEVADADIDAPWLPDADYFRVNGVDVIPFVEAELDRRFPGRAQRRAADPDGLRAAWAVLERTWAATLDRVCRDARRHRRRRRWTVSGRSRRRCGTWSSPRTRGWARRSCGSTSRSTRSVSWTRGRRATALDLSVFTTETPTYAEVLDARADRVAMVRDLLAGVTADELDAPRSEPARARSTRRPSAPACT